LLYQLSYGILLCLFKVLQR